MIDPNWDRWIMASMVKAFADSLPQYKLFVEGQPIDDSVIQADHLEFRLNGPEIQEASKDTFYIDVEINVLVVAQIDPSDLYKPRKMAGDVAAAFSNNICIYKYGDNAYDDQTYLGTMILDTKTNKSRVHVAHFGQIDPNISVSNATVSGTYCMTL